MQRLADVHARGDDVEEVVLLEPVYDRAAGHGKHLQARFGRDVHEAADIGLGAKRGRRNQVLRGNPGRIAPQRDVRQIEKPPHFEVVGLLLEIFGEVLECLLGARAVSVRRPGPWWEEAKLARAAKHTVVHPRLVKIGDAHRFEHRRDRAGHEHLREGVGYAPPLDRLVHIAQIRVELSPRILGLHGIQLRFIVCRDRRPFETVEQLGDRLGTGVANRSKIGIPIVRLRRAKQNGVRLVQAGHRERDLYGSCRRGSQDACGIVVVLEGWRVSIGKNQQHRIACRDPDDACISARLNTSKGIAQLRTQGRRIDFPQVAAVTGGRVDGFFSGQRLEILASSEPFQHVLGLFLRSRRR